MIETGNPHIRTERSGRTLLVTIDRDDKLNALNWAMIDALIATLRKAEDDPEIGAIILRGAGRAFSTGFDLKDSTAEIVDSPQQDMQSFRRAAAAWRALWDIHADAAAATEGLQNYDNAGVNMIINKTMPSEAIASMIVAHVFRDNPGLKLVCVETGVGWMAHLVSWMDVLIREHPTMYPGMTEMPSETFHRHVFGSFLWDSVGIANRDVIGVENIMWCSDYPHNYGPFPNSQAQIERELAGLSADERHLILAGNACRVFGLGL